MEILAAIFWLGIGFLIGVYTPILAGRIKRKRDVEDSGPKKPEPNKFSNYTLDELYQHKKYLESQIRQHLHYPALRAHNMEDLAIVVSEIDWREMQDGTYAINQQRKARQAELEAFDQEMRNI